MSEDRGVKKDEGKLKFSLIPITALRELVKNYTQGAGVHGERNWEKGIEYSRCFDAIQRHSWDWFHGEDFDVSGRDPSNIHHMACVAFWSLAAVFFHFAGRTDLDDRPKPKAPPVVHQDCCSLPSDLFDEAIKDFREAVKDSKEQIEFADPIKRDE